MNRAIFRKTWADLRSRPLQTALLGVVIFLAAATLTIAFALRAQAGQSFEDLMDDANGAHAWFMAPDRATVEQISQQAGVTGVAGPYPRAFGEVAGENEHGNIDFWGMPATEPEVSRPILTSGRWLDAAGTNEAVLEAGYARALGAQPGDEITVRTPVGDTPLTVVGIALTTSSGPYPVNEPGQALVLASTAEHLAAGQPDWEVGVQLDEPGEAADFVAAILSEAADATPGDDRPMLAATDWEHLRDNVAKDAEVTVIFFSVFSVFVIGAMALIIANIVSSAVLGQSREVGLLKAVGFTPRQVTSVFLFAQLGVGLVAATIGVIAGFALAPLFLDDVGGVLPTSATPQFNVRTLLIVVLVVESIVAVFAILPAWHAGRLPAVSAIAGRTEQGKQASRLSRVARSLRLPPLVTLGVKDAFARPMRAWFTVGALAIALGSAAMALSILQTLSRGADDPSMFANETYNLRVFPPPDPGATERALDAARQDARVDGVVTDSFLVATTAGGVQQFDVHAFAGDTEEAFPNASAGRTPSAPGEVLVSEQLAEREGLAVGDRFTPELAFNDGTSEIPTSVSAVEFVVVGLFEETDEDGPAGSSVMLTLREGIGDVGPLPTTVGLQLRDIDDSVAVSQGLRETLGDSFDVQDEVEENREDMENTVSDARPILLALIGMLMIVAVINVLTTFLFAVRERYREVGVLKAIGLTPGEVLLTVPVGGCVLALIGAAIGIPAGLFITEQLFEYFGRGEGWKDGVAVTPAWWQLLLLVPVAVLLATLGSLLPARRAASMPVTEALRWE